MAWNTFGGRKCYVRPYYIITVLGGAPSVTALLAVRSSRLSLVALSCCRATPNSTAGWTLGADADAVMPGRFYFQALQCSRVAAAAPTARPVGDSEAGVRSAVRASVVAITTGRRQNQINRWAGYRAQGGSALDPGSARRRLFVVTDQCVRARAHARSVDLDGLLVRPTAPKLPSTRSPPHGSFVEGQAPPLLLPSIYRLWRGWRKAGAC